MAKAVCADALEASCRGLECSVAATISVFLGEAVVGGFTVSPGSIVTCRTAFRRRKDPWAPGMPGSIGVLACSNCRGKLVRVDSIIYRVDASAVSASIDMEEYPSAQPRNTATALR